MMPRILILHYTPPGVVGGVEGIIQQHTLLLTARGFPVEVVAGRTGEIEVPFHLIPEIDAARPENVEIEDELARGVVSEQFEQTRRLIMEKLEPVVARAEVVIAHNAFTLHFSLPLTSVLWDLAAGRPPGSMIAWCHDLAWTNPLYIPAMYHAPPWTLLRMAAPNTTYVTVSAERKAELAGLWGEGADRIVVVPNGIDPIKLLRLSTFASDLVSRYELFDRDIVLLLPVRITRRKNIEAGIRAVRSLKDRGLDVRFLISGPVAPHHPARSRSYLADLKALRAELNVSEEVIFLSDELGKNLDDQAVAELFTVADALLFPSAQEGFGLPILEAGAARLPVVLSDLPIFREVGGSDVRTFPLDSSADTIAAEILRSLDNGPSRLYRRVLREYRWDAITDRKILPLLPGYGAWSQQREAAGAVDDEIRS
jgi:glycosyltransferase involved in cell wall biosynthesis